MDNDEAAARVKKEEARSLSQNLKRAGRNQIHLDSSPQKRGFTSSPADACAGAPADTTARSTATAAPPENPVLASRGWNA